MCEIVAMRTGERCYSFNTGAGLPSPANLSSFVLNGVSRLVQGKPLYDNIFFSGIRGDPISLLHLPISNQVTKDALPGVFPHRISNETDGISFGDLTDQAVIDGLIDRGIDPKKQLSKSEVKAMTQELQQVYDFIDGAIAYIPGLKQSEQRWIKGKGSATRPVLLTCPMMLTFLYQW